MTARFALIVAFTTSCSVGSLLTNDPISCDDDASCPPAFVCTFGTCEPVVSEGEGEVACGTVETFDDEELESGIVAFSDDAAVVASDGTFDVQVPVGEEAYAGVQYVINDSGARATVRVLRTFSSGVPGEQLLFSIGAGDERSLVAFVLEELELRTIVMLDDVPTFEPAGPHDPLDEITLRLTVVPAAATGEYDVTWEAAQDGEELQILRTATKPLDLTNGQVSIAIGNSTAGGSEGVASVDDFHVEPLDVCFL